MYLIVWQLGECVLHAELRIFNELTIDCARVRIYFAAYNVKCKSYS